MLHGWVLTACMQARALWVVRCVTLRHCSSPLLLLLQPAHACYSRLLGKQAELQELEARLRRLEAELRLLAAGRRAPLPLPPALHPGGPQRPASAGPHAELDAARAALEAAAAEAAELGGDCMRLDQEVEVLQVEQQQLLVSAPEGWRVGQRLQRR